jgi:hypothetical protein
MLEPARPMNERTQGVWKAQRVFVPQPSAELAEEFRLPTTHRASSRLLVGRHEWIGLQELGPLPWIAKTDTGARTSTLHATEVEIDATTRTVHFLTTTSDGTIIACRAPLSRTKTIRNSAGITEHRPIILTRAVFAGGLTFSIELTLTDRRHMKCPVLLGRRALAGYFLVDPQSDYLLGNLDDFLSSTPANQPL